MGVGVGEEEGASVGEVVGLKVGLMVGPEGRPADREGRMRRPRGCSVSSSWVGGMWWVPT